MMKKSLIFCYCLMMVLLTFGCGATGEGGNSGNRSTGDKTEKKEVVIEPYKVLSYGAFFKSLGITSPDQGVDFIQGFTYEWGYTYVLKVKVTTLANPPMDASNKEVELIDEISKTPVPEDYQFALRLENERYLGMGEEPSPLLVPNGENVWRYDEDIDLEVPEEFLPAFEQVLNEGASKTATCEFVEPGLIRIVKLD